VTLSATDDKIRILNSVAVSKPTTIFTVQMLIIHAANRSCNSLCPSKPIGSRVARKRLGQYSRLQQPGRRRQDTYGKIVITKYVVLIGKYIYIYRLNKAKMWLNAHKIYTDMRVNVNSNYIKSLAVDTCDGGAKTLATPVESDGFRLLGFSASVCIAALPWIR